MNLEYIRRILYKKTTVINGRDFITEDEAEIIICNLLAEQEKEIKLKQKITNLSTDSVHIKTVL